jgi:dTDP-4-dehydrorhamnose 3,5-epimerase-like enzyme
MEVVKTTIAGVFIVEPTVFGDERGYFFESFNAEEFEQKTLKSGQTPEEAMLEEALQ